MEAKFGQEILTTAIHVFRVFILPKTYYIVHSEEYKEVSRDKFAKMCHDSVRKLSIEISVKTCFTTTIYSGKAPTEAISIPCLLMSLLCVNHMKPVTYSKFAK